MPVTEDAENMPTMALLQTNNEQSSMRSGVFGGFTQSIGNDKFETPSFNVPPQQMSFAGNVNQSSGHINGGKLKQSEKLKKLQTQRH